MCTIGCICWARKPVPNAEVFAALSARFLQHASPTVSFCLSEASFHCEVLQKTDEKRWELRCINPSLGMTDLLPEDVI
uniref:Uncharacterized protein n=1 Tax=Ascaris lumbricoides TaxID=6252 RepID=A0A9J2P6G5_ASCLU